MSARTSPDSLAPSNVESARINHLIGRITYYASRTLVPLVLLTLFAFLLRRYHLSSESLWFDEADIVSRARQPASVLLQGFTQAGENGPLYTLFLHYWLALLDAVPLLGRVVQAIFGMGYEAPVRALSVLFGTVSIAPMYFLARRVGGHWVGLLAAALLTINPFHIWHSQDAKMYSLLVLMTLVSTLLYVKAIERNTLILWSGYVISTWVMLTTHSMAVLVLLAQLVTTPFLFRSRNSDNRGQPSTDTAAQNDNKSKIQNPKSKILIVRWGWAMLLILGPLFPIAWLRGAALVTNTVDVGGWYAPAGLHDIIGTVAVNFAVNRADPLWEIIAALTMGVMAVLGGWRLLWTTDDGRRTKGDQTGLSNPKSKIQNPKSALGLLILALCLLPIAGLWLVTLRVPLFQARYLIMALPAYLILVAAGIIWLRRINPLLMVIPLAVIALTSSVALAGVNYSSQPQKEDWRGAMVYVQDHARLRDVIVVFPGYLRTAVDEYYEPGGPGHVPLIPIETIPSLHTQGFGERELDQYLREKMTCYERAWLITSPTRQEQEDPEKSVQQWFQYNNQTFDTQEFNGVTVYGIAFNGVYNCWYPPPDFPEVHRFEIGLEFSGYIYELRDDATAQTDASFFPLTLYWRSGPQMSTNYLVNVKITDSSGKIVKEEALGPLNGYWPMSQWPSYKDIIDYRDIRLSGGMAPGSYSVSLQVYPPDRPDQPLRLEGGGTEIVFKEPLQIVPWHP
ncbi:MAG TPA: glycosyltransferase family 39 protein [Chloroflexia bacterium]|nr:glycosyltransferase family 39 protein [Chloroflexia bacterium]